MVNAAVAIAAASTTLWECFIMRLETEAKHLGVRYGKKDQGWNNGWTAFNRHLETDYEHWIFCCRKTRIWSWSSSSRGNWRCHLERRRRNERDQRKVGEVFNKIHSWRPEERECWYDIQWRAYCKYMDYLTTVDIFNSAPYHQRHRDENTITMKSGDPDHQAGPMAKREDYKMTTKLLCSLRQEVNSFIPKEKRTRQRNLLDPQLQERLEWLSQHWREHFSAASTSSTSTWTQNGWSENNWQDDRRKKAPTVAKQMNSVQHASGSSLRTLMILLKTSRVSSDQAENVFYYTQRFPCKRREA